MQGFAVKIPHSKHKYAPECSMEPVGCAAFVCLKQAFHQNLFTLLSGAVCCSGTLSRRRWPLPSKLGRTSAFRGAFSLPLGLW